MPFSFDVAKLPLQRMGSIHKEMIDTIKKVADRKKQIQHILTVSNTINKVMVHSSETNVTLEELLKLINNCMQIVLCRIWTN